MYYHAAMQSQDERDIAELQTILAYFEECLLGGDLA
jgi:hypothetical protein